MQIYLVEFVSGTDRRGTYRVCSDSPVDAAREVVTAFAEDGDEGAFITGVFEMVNDWGAYV